MNTSTISKIETFIYLPHWGILRSGDSNTMGIDDETFHDFYNESKVIDEDISWEYLGGGRFTIKNVEILSNVIHDKSIKLFCRANITNDFAFIIVLWGNKEQLVKYDKKIHPPQFIDKCSGDSIREPHKHKFKVGCSNGYMMKIPNSEIDRTDVNKALFQFFEECNITLKGEYEKIPKISHQTDLSDHDGLGGQ